MALYSLRLYGVHSAHCCAAHTIAHWIGATRFHANNLRDMYRLLYHPVCPRAGTWVGTAASLHVQRSGFSRSSPSRMVGRKGGYLALHLMHLPPAQEVQEFIARNPGHGAAGDARL